MNNSPAMTEAQRAEIIKLCTSAINETPDDDEVVMHLIAQIALAAVTRDNAKLAREIVRRLVDGGAADPEVVASSEAWVLKKLNGVKS